MSGTRRRSVTERIGSDYGWLLAQFLLLGLAFIAGPAGSFLDLCVLFSRFHGVAFAVGALLLASAVVVVVQAQKDLGDSLRVAPTPLEDAQLVERGWYGRVRHPLYLAVLLGVIGWTLLWLNALSALTAICVVIFLQLKSRHEERLLQAAYPGYVDYMMRVRSRFVPRIWKF